MSGKYGKYKEYIKIFILFFIIITIANISKVYASTINESNIVINIHSDGVCHIEENFDMTAIDKLLDYSSEYLVASPSVQLTRGKNIEKLCINKVEISENDINNYYNDYAGVINLAYSQPRTLSIFVIIQKKS